MNLFVRLAGEARIDVHSLPVVRVPVADAPAVYQPSEDSGLLTGILDYGAAK